MVVRVFMNNAKKTWHMCTASVFVYQFHTPVTNDGKTLSINDLNHDQQTTLRILHGSRVSSNVIARAMPASVFQCSGKQGEFLADTINNIGNSEQRVIGTLQGMKSEWSEAKKVLHILDK